MPPQPAAPLDAEPVIYRGLGITALTRVLVIVALVLFIPALLFSVVILDGLGSVMMFISIMMPGSARLHYDHGGCSAPCPARPPEELDQPIHREPPPLTAPGPGTSPPLVKVTWHGISTRTLIYIRTSQRSASSA